MFLLSNYYTIIGKSQLNMMSNNNTNLDSISILSHFLKIVISGHSKNGNPTEKKKTVFDKCLFN